MKRTTAWNTGPAWRVILWSGLIGIVLVGLQADALAAGTFTLQSASGSVQMQTGGTGPWRTIHRGTHRASAGDHIKTGANGSVHIVNPHGQRIALGPNTEVVLRVPKKKSIWQVLKGKVMAIINGAAGLEVRTPSAVAAAEGTTFQVEVAEDGTSVLTVAQGEVVFYNDLGRVTVAGSQQSTARPGEPPSRPVVIDPSSLMAWEASLDTLIIEAEYPPVPADVEALEKQRQEIEADLDEKPDDPALHAALADILLRLGRTDVALEHAQRAVEGSDEPSYRGILGIALLRAGHVTEASAHLAAAAEGEPDNARWDLALGITALGQGNITDAIETLSRAAELAPTDPVPAAYLAAAQLRAGDLEAAASAVADAKQADPDNYLTAAYNAYLQLAQGNTDEAVAAGDRSAAAAPGSALANEAAGTAHFFAGNFDRAFEHLNRAIELNPLSASAHLTLAKLHAARDDLQEALAGARHAVGLDPQSAPARSTLGLLLMLNDDPRRAGQQFEEALALDPGLAEARTGWGTSLEQKGRFGEALDAQKAAVALDTDSAAAQNNLGGLYAAFGEMDKATEHLQRAIELQPGWGMPYANLAVVYLEQNQFALALQTAEKAVELGERSPFVHTVLARIYMEQGRDDRAFEQLQQAVALDEEYPQAHFELSRLYLKQDRARDAVRTILTSTARDPSAMLETRLYARTEATAATGRFEKIHLDAHHSGMCSDGRWSYFGSGLWQDNDAYRQVNQDSNEWFGEIIVGHESHPEDQFVFYSTMYDNDAGLPGSVGPGNPADPDDSREFDGYEAIALYRHHFSPDVSGMFKYTYRESDLDFSNPGSLTGADTNPFRTLNYEQEEQSPEFRIDARIGEDRTLSVGYSHKSEEREQAGQRATIDPATGDPVFSPFGNSTDLDVDTAFFETTERVNDRLDVTLGAYWGKYEGSASILRPKVAAIYRPDSLSSCSFFLTPTFRADALELAPVEALADPHGLSYLNFVEGGAGESYEVRYQKQTSDAANLTASVTYQDVDGLLVPVEDAAVTGLPRRLLMSKGDRWIGDISYEKWLSDRITGRVWARWQSTDGDFPQSGVTGQEWPYAPDWQAGARLDYIDENGFRIGLEAMRVGDRFANPENTSEVDAYTLFNLRASKQDDLRHNYFIELRNLTDENYQTFSGYPQRGRAIYGGFEYRF